MSDKGIVGILGLDVGVAGVLFRGIGFDTLQLELSVCDFESGVGLGRLDTVSSESSEGEKETGQGHGGEHYQQKDSSSQVGIGEGRPDSKQSTGQGWGLFKVEMMEAAHVKS